MEDIAGSILKVQGATLAVHDETSIPFFSFSCPPGSYWVDSFTPQRGS